MTQASKQPTKQTSKNTDFTVNLLSWGSLRLAPTIQYISFLWCMASLRDKLVITQALVLCLIYMHLLSGIVCIYQ